MAVVYSSPGATHRLISADARVTRLRVMPVSASVVEGLVRSDSTEAKFGKGYGHRSPAG